MWQFTARGDGQVSPGSSSGLHSSSSSHCPHSPWSCGSLFGVSQTPSFHPAPHLAALPAPLTHQSLLLLGNAASPQSLGLFLKDLCSCWRHRRAQKLGGFGAPGRAGFNCPCSSTSPSTCPRQPKPQKLDAPCEEHNVHLVLAAKDLKDDFWDQGSL